MKRLHYTKPAAVWDEALPLGNGRLGAMAFGRIGRERIQLNEDSIWSGNFRDRNNADARANLEALRNLIDEGRHREAGILSQEAFSGTPVSQRVYQSAGDLYIEEIGLSLEESVSQYARELDLETAVHTTRFVRAGVSFKRECFVSAVDGVLAVRYSSDSPGSISFRAQLDRGVFIDRLKNMRVRKESKTDDGIAMFRDEAIGFAVMATTVALGEKANAFARGGFLTVEGADEAMLFLDIRTRFRESDPEAACAENLARAASLGWDALRERHVRDYSNLFSRAEFSLGESANGQGGARACESVDAVPTNVRLSGWKESLLPCPDPSLVGLYWDYCRYLLISSSREGTLPANLQGIWNEHLDPPWGSKFTININTEMNYWCASPCALGELELPLFDHLERMYENGRETARRMYGCRGFVAHHNTDVWGDCAPQDHWLPATQWVLGAAWLATHIREHYEYTLDRKFLAKHFHLMSEACLFFVDYLIERNRALIVHPSISPENTYRFRGGEDGMLCAGCEMDNQILRHLFSQTIVSANELGVTEHVDEFRSVFERLRTPRVHSNGTIMEWNEEYEEAEIGHRHISHLYALFPGNEISPANDVRLAEAARRTLERRLSHGGGHTGWSRAWIINFRAALFEGDEALVNVKALLASSTLDNLFDNHPPFQIDGNFGALAGITRMLVQSELSGDGSVLVRLLPALPTAWPEGKLSGIRVKGALAVSLSWKGGRVERCFFTRLSGGAARRVRVVTEGRETPLELTTSEGEECPLPLR